MKSAHRLRLYYEERKDVSFTFLEDDSERISFCQLYENAAILASWLIKKDLTGSNAAIISRNSKFAYESFVSISSKINSHAVGVRYNLGHFAAILVFLYYA